MSTARITEPRRLGAHTGGLTRAEVAVALGVSASMVQKIEERALRKMLVAIRSKPEFAELLEDWGYKSRKRVG